MGREQLSRFTGERVFPEMLRPREMRSSLLNEPYATPLGLILLWREHKIRYEFARNLCEGKKVLDLACGAGYGVEILKTSNYVGVDISIATLVAAGERFKSEFVSADCVFLPFSDRSFERVVSFETIEHIAFERTECFLRECVRVLDEDGIFLVSTPNRDVTNPGKTLLDRPPNKYHEFELSLEELENMLLPFFGSVGIYGQGAVTRPPRRKNLTTLKDVVTQLVTGDFAKIRPLSEYRERGSLPVHYLAICKHPFRK